MPALPSAPVIDAHHHLWSLAAYHNPWLAARGVRRFFGDPTPIQRDYGRAEFVSDQDGVAVETSVVVEAGAGPVAALAEACFVEGELAGSGAMVAHADLTDPALADRLDALAAAAPRLRGVRQIVGRHPDEDGKHPDLLADPRFPAGLGELARRGLSFDLQLTAPMLPRAAEVLADVPGLRVALCHCGSPWDRSPAGLAAWRDGLARLAALPGSVAKLSGFGMFDPLWTAASIAPLVDEVLAAFGPARAMWGSNFPVEKLARPWPFALGNVAANIAPADHAAVFADTARAFYRL